MFDNIGKSFVKELRFSSRIWTNARKTFTGKIVTSCKIRLQGYGQGFVTGGYMSKGEWKRMEWGRAWELENTPCRIKVLLRHTLGLLDPVCCTPRYLDWWQLADKHPEHIRVCETVAKLLCRASSLQRGDVRIKGAQLHGAKAATLQRKKAQSMSSFNTPPKPH